MASQNPREIKQAPPHKNQIKCLWCDKKMLGRNLGRHNKRSKHSYQSYCVVAQPSVLSLFGRTSTISKNKTN